MTYDENPSSRLISPCACRGSQSYVHISCLNEWRATSTSALYQCYICKSEYRTERTKLAEILMHPLTVQCLTVIVVLLGVLLAGCILLQADKYFLRLDLLRRICDVSGVSFDMMRRRCTMPWYHRRYEYLVNALSERRSLAEAWSVSKWFQNMQFLAGYASQQMYCKQSQALDSILEVCFGGGSVVALCGMLNQYAYRVLWCDIIKRQWDLYRATGRMVFTREMAVVVFWIATIVPNENLGRLSVIFGMAWSYVQLYAEVMIRTRKVAQAIGETILEPY